MFIQSIQLGFFSEDINFCGTTDIPLLTSGYVCPGLESQDKSHTYVLCCQHTVYQ